MLISKGFRVSYFPLVVQERIGATVKDVEGMVYIDLLASEEVNNTGYAAILEAITRQAKAFIHYTSRFESTT